jgi:hypothetical protein
MQRSVIFPCEESDGKGTAESNVIEKVAEANPLSFLDGKPVFDAQERLKIGRQVLAYGDEKLVGGFDWSTYARTPISGICRRRSLLSFFREKSS